MRAGSYILHQYCSPIGGYGRRDLYRCPDPAVLLVGVAGVHDTLLRQRDVVASDKIPILVGTLQRTVRGIANPNPASSLTGA